MIHLYTGNGKGKTTASVGLLVRAAGNGFPVMFAQFMKGNDTGELHVLQELPQVRILRSEKNFGFYKNMTEEQKQELTEIHNRMLDSLLQIAEENTVRLIVLDEITYPVKWGLLDVAKLKRLLTYDKIEWIMTGRDAADFMVEAADYITEMDARKHPFEQGIAARKGIEF